MQDDSINIKSENGIFVVELKKPSCGGCGIPNWKFPWIKDEPDQREMELLGGFYSVSSSLGILRLFVDTSEGRECLCANCVKPIVQSYLDGHPFITKSRAISVVRRRLDEAGYEGVDILADQVWRMGEKQWTFMTGVHYQRDGRKILRYTGTPVFSDEGEFKLNMAPHEYVNFRYQ